MTSTRNTLAMDSSSQHLQSHSAKPPTKRTRADAAHPALRLQRLVGNNAVNGLIQAKLAANVPDDPCERQADEIAAEVVQRIDNTTGAVATRRRPLAWSPAPRPTAGLAVDDGLESAIHRARGGGEPLAEGVRAPLEQAFGVDLSPVRIHASASSDNMTRGMHALAFTAGTDVFVRQDCYRPGMRSGLSLIAHELVHVVQQTGGGYGHAVEIPKTTPTPHIVQRIAIGRVEVDETAIDIETLKGHIETLRRRKLALLPLKLDASFYEEMDDRRWLLIAELNRRLTSSEKLLQQTGGGGGNAKEIHKTKPTPRFVQTRTTVRGVTFDQKTIDIEALPKYIKILKEQKAIIEAIPVDERHLEKRHYESLDNRIARLNSELQWRKKRHNRASNNNSDNNNNNNSFLDNLLKKNQGNAIFAPASAAAPRTSPPILQPVIFNLHCSENDAHTALQNYARNARSANLLPKSPIIAIRKYTITAQDAPYDKVWQKNADAPSSCGWLEIYKLTGAKWELHVHRHPNGALRANTVQESDKAGIDRGKLSLLEDEIPALGIAKKVNRLSSAWFKAFLGFKANRIDIRYKQVWQKPAPLAPQDPGYKY